MTTIDTKLRADGHYAESVIRGIFKGLPPVALRSYLEFLNASIQFVSAAYSDRWGITLFEDKVRLNVGWVEVLILWSEGLRVLVEEESAPTGTRFVRFQYKTAPGCYLTDVPLAGLRTQLPALSEAHLNAMSIAAKRNSPKSIRKAHSTGVIAYMEQFLRKRVPNPSYRLEESSGQNYLVLWKYSEAETDRGKVFNRAWGTHATGLSKGDRMFITATTGNELFLLGVIEVERSGERSCTGKSLFGTFDIIPLKGLKWRLRFKSSASQKISPQYPLARQVRSRRILTPESAELLEEFISSGKARKHDDFVAHEGQSKEFTLLKRERDPRLRAIVLAQRGAICEICGFDFELKYGEFAADCVEVHHLHLLSEAQEEGTTTSVDDVIVACPNCHRALHKFRDPSNWKALRRACGLSRKTGD
jgi:5-methylcytosine-specific restriction protein A